MQMNRSLAAAGLAARCTLAAAQSRLPTIPPASYTPEQKQASQEFQAARKVPVFGPFEPLLYSPQVMTQARCHLGVPTTRRDLAEATDPRA